MSGPAPSPPFPAAHPPSAGARRRLPRLAAYERIQVLLVLWIGASEALNVGLGLTFLPIPGDAAPSSRLAAGALLLTIAHAVAYPLAAFVASRRFPLWSRPARHAAYFAAVAAALHASALLCAVLAPELDFGWKYFARRSFEFVVYTVFAHGMLYGERYHEKEREELRLRAEMAESSGDRMRAQVRSLKMEWSPRFLTGTLARIGELLARDVPAAKRLLLALSSVLRRTLAHVRVETLRLGQEADFVREVLRVEALRRPGLAVEWDVDDEAMEMPVPHMSLLTLVYQALPEDGSALPVRLRIHAAPEGEGVRMAVEAAGVPAEAAAVEDARADADEDAAENAGEERFGAVYGAGHHFRRSRTAGDGVRLELVCAPGPARTPREALPRATRTDSAGGGHADARTESASVPAAEDGGPAVGLRLEMATYAVFLVFYTGMALHTAHLRVEAGRVVLAAAEWVYVLGIGAYAVVWWASLAAVARWLSVRHPLRQANWPRRLGVHALGALAVSLANAVAYAPFQKRAVEGGGVSIGLLSSWEWGDLTAYPLLAGIAHGFLYARELHAKRVSEMRLRSLLSESELARTEAELRALKAELDPHFLFNALNTVSSLMHTRVDEAGRVVAHLSAILRRVVESGSLREVTVEEEVEFIRLYMEIEQARFGDALRMTYDVDPATLRARVPHLLIQPLVENAVKHGLRPRGGTGRVTLATRRAGAVLELTVEDDGVGTAQPSAAEGTGTGLANVRRRLRELYRDEHAFELGPGAAGGTTARIRIPFCEAPRAAVRAPEPAGLGQPA